MSLFDELVNQALLSQTALGTVRPAVEKELLHHDILREMSRASLLTGLTFIGGTCLRMCYGSQRLSEDLDFTGGSDFHPDQLMDLKNTLESTLMEKYGLPVFVSEPQLEAGNVSTWKFRLETQPSQKQLPVQRIHIDVCALPSRQRRPSLLRNHYGVDMGSDGLIVQAESRQEILADKWVALAMRPNRVQYRDLWDIIYLQQRGVELSSELVGLKLSDRSITTSAFRRHLRQRINELAADQRHSRQFTQEMSRFLPAAPTGQVFEDPNYWSALIGALKTGDATLFS
jgi:predicted nucleotidyltransferase component of viral defense system